MHPLSFSLQASFRPVFVTDFPKCERDFLCIPAFCSGMRKRRDISRVHFLSGMRTTREMLMIRNRWADKLEARREKESWESRVNPSFSSFPSFMYQYHLSRNTHRVSETFLSLFLCPGNDDDEDVNDEENPKRSLFLFGVTLSLDNHAWEKRDIVDWKAQSGKCWWRRWREKRRMYDWLPVLCYVMLTRCSLITGEIERGSFSSSFDTHNWSGGPLCSISREDRDLIIFIRSRKIPVVTTSHAWPVLSFAKSFDEFLIEKAVENL